ncbi:protein C1orf43 homolog isoform X2 [Lineus longissimus]|uniref:protein C1orf43 homolog isoform X2 n=1 Tax=Lineus longissimus TaxID=88925 RepID=UPI002B4F219F
MVKEISLVSVVLFIACGTLVFIIIFVFAKRQITRFTLKSDKSPHAPIGRDAPKQLRNEIDRRLKRVAEIKVEPKLMSPYYEDAFQNGRTHDCHFLFRMKAVDSLMLLDQEIKFYDSRLKRKAGQHLRQYLLNLTTGPLKMTKIELIHDFADAYDNARHGPATFGEKEFIQYMEYLTEIVENIKCQIPNRRNSTASAASATSQTALITTTLLEGRSAEVKYRHSKQEGADNLSHKSAVA